MFSPKATSDDQKVTNTLKDFEVLARGEPSEDADRLIRTVDDMIVHEEIKLRAEPGPIPVRC
jgi:hypothetical protein